MVVFPQCLKHTATPLGRTQLANQNALCRRLARQRHKDPQQFIPLLDDQGRVEFAHGPEQCITAIVLRMLKAIERCSHLLLDIGIARGKTIPKDFQQYEIDLICAVGIGRMDARLDVGRIVVEQIEHPLALMVVGTDQFGMHRDVIGDQRGRYDALALPKILGRMLGLHCGPLGFKLLAVAARMDHTVNIVVAKERQGGHRIDDPRVGRPYGFQAQVVLRGAHQGPRADVRAFAHAIESQIGAPSNQTRPEHTSILRLVTIAAQHMLKGVHECTSRIDQGQHIFERELGQALKQRVVDRIARSRCLKGPAPRGAMLRDLHCRIVAGGYPPVDTGKLRFQVLFQRGQVLHNRLLEDRELGFGQILSLALVPLGDRDEVILNAAKAHTLPTKHITGFQGCAEELVDKKLVAITEQLWASLRRSRVQVALEMDRNAARGNRVGGYLSERSITGEEILEKGNSPMSALCP